MSEITLQDMHDLLADLAAEKEELTQYVEQLNAQERIVYELAQRQLGTSFCLEQSVGFLEWQKKRAQSGN